MVRRPNGCQRPSKPSVIRGVTSPSKSPRPMAGALKEMPTMNLLKTLHALLGRSQPPSRRIERVEQTVMRIDELPPFTLHTAELMRFDPQVRIGLGARNGLLMAAEVEVTGSDPAVTAWVQHQ